MGQNTNNDETSSCDAASEILETHSLLHESFSSDKALSTSSSTKVLPPIERSDTGVQTDISLLSGDAVSSFRPDILPAQDYAPYPPLPVIATISAPAILNATENPGTVGRSITQISDPNNDSSTPNDTSASSQKLNGHHLPGGDSGSEGSGISKDGSYSEYQPTDSGSVSDYSAVSELEGVGPPTILQYIKESSRVRRSVPSPKPVSERFPVVEPGKERGNTCPFCHTELLPVPPLSDTSEDEGERTPTRMSASPPYGIKDSEKGEVSSMRGKGAVSVFSVESPPPMIAGTEDEDRVPNDGYLYCCEDYYWHLVNKNRLERRDSFYQEGEVMEVKKIDVSPHAPFGSKAARKLAKDRANERVRERELEKVRPLGGAPRAAGGATTLFSYARQMKTINFALSSRKCLEDGWTVTNYLPPPKSPDPVLYDTMEETQSHPLPGLSVPWQQTAHQFSRYYRNGTTFLTLLPDGTGVCYYPSGAPAILITLQKPGMYTYYVMSDSDHTVQLLAVCSQSGRSTVFHQTGAIHYQCTPTSGDIFNRAEVRTKHWEWDALSPHVHAPPFQPVYFQISPFFSMRCVSLEQQTLVFSYKRYTFKCSIGSRTKKLIAKPLECPQLIQYQNDLITSKSKINDTLRKLNNCISAAHNIASKDTRVIKPPKTSPRKSADSARVSVAV